MPENDNNFNQNNEFNNELPKRNTTPFDLPRMNDDLENSQNSTNTQESTNKPIIEIPQAYYDKLAKEQLAKIEEEKRQQELREETKEALNDTGGFLVFVLINALVIFGLFYVSLNYINWALIGIPVVLLVLTVLSAKNDKENSSYPSTVMVGGMLVAIVTFILSMLQEDKSDMWMVYTILSAAIGFLGMMGSNIITTLMTNFKNVSAMKVIGYILYFVIIIGGPIYVLKNYREEVYRYLFNQQVEVQALTETEFVLKTLKTRYGIDFKCGIYANDYDQANGVLTYDKYKSQIDQFNRKYTERICRDNQDRDVLVQSKTYDEGNVKYIVIDDYIDVLFLDGTKESIVKDIQGITNAQTVTLYMYPKENCTFYGDCVDVDDYFTNYEKEINVDNQFKTSTDLNFIKELATPPLEYINNHQYKYVLKITSSYGTNTNYSNVVDTVLNRLNALGYKNTYGYEITLYTAQSSADGDTEQAVYKVKGESNQEQTFKDPVEVNTNASK